MITKIEKPCPHCGHDLLQVQDTDNTTSFVICKWVDCAYVVKGLPGHEAAVKFANKRTDKSKLALVSLMRDAYHIITTSQLEIDQRTVSDKSLAIFHHKCDQMFGDEGEYKPLKQ